MQNNFAQYVVLTMINIFPRAELLIGGVINSHHTGPNQFLYHLRW